MLANSTPSSTKDKNSPTRSTYAGPTQPIPKKSLQIRTDKPRPHVCSICTRAFARLEHLKRHERSHTNEKPFQCAACGRCFARRDLVLRHQQKLHLNIFSVVRRGLLPATLLQPPPELTTSTPTGDNIIILQNNTSAKAPLPNQLRTLSPTGNMPELGMLLPMNDVTLPHDLSSHLSAMHYSTHTGNSINIGNGSHTNALNGSAVGNGSFLGPPQDLATMPLPSTNLSHNTPSFTILGHQYPLTYSDIDPLQVVGGFINPDMTQQPSPLTGDSPEVREKNRTLSAESNKANAPVAPTNVLHSNVRPMHVLDRSNGSALSRTNSGFAHRHASFSAVLGISYTNLQDAMAIRNTQFTDVPQQVGFATPQMTAEEMEHKGFSEDFSNLEMDWYSLDYGSSLPAKESGLIAAPTSANSRRSYRTDSSSNGFKIKLNTIPSETHLAQTGDSDYFASNIMAGHQFLDPSHPHHIKGTTPIEFGYSSFTDVASVLGSDGKNLQVGTGFANLAQDVLDLKEPHDKNGTTSIATPGLISGRDSAPPTAKGTTKPGAKPGSLRRQTLTIINTDYKRANLGSLANLSNISNISNMNTMTSMSDAEDLAWVEQIRGIPVPSEFPLASRNTGFEGFPYMNDQFDLDEVFSLFKLRQDDLVKKRSTVNAAQLDETYSVTSSTDHGGSKMDRTLSKVKFTIGDTNDVISEELRARIVADSKLADAKFPPCEDLNAYLNLYEKEFNTYYPFIHMPTLKSARTNNVENVPLLLLMCAIGALYLYHDLNTLLLFNLSKFHIHNFFEKEVTVDKLQFKKVPIMAHQCLVLHIFILMFLNEPNMVEITSRQMNSMVGLIKSTNFHRPLEQFLVPPPAIVGPLDHAGIQKNFDYFIMTQTRIRTIQTFYQLEVLRSALLGCPLPMKGADVKCGSHCNDENLWKLANPDEWYRHLQNSPGKSLVELSNNESMGIMFEQLNSGSLVELKMSFSKLFALVMHVHEQILNEYTELKGDIEPLLWRVHHRPRLETLCKAWESHFIRNGGFSLVNNHNHHLLRTRAELKLIIPMSLLAKMRVCVNFTPVITQVLYKDWPGMEAMIKKLDGDMDALKEAARYAIEVLNLWIHNISMLNDAKQTSVRTPVFFVTCIFVSVVILSKVLHVIENSAEPSVFDRAFWLRCVKTLNGIETALSPKEESSYLEFLRAQSHGVFDYAWSNAFKQNVDKSVKALNSGDVAAADLHNCKLSILSLSLGVRILADAPLWPLAMGFAEALKNMATQFNETK